MTSKPAHPGFTPAAFDLAVYRAFDRGIAAEPTTIPGTYRVDSGTTPGLSYLTTARTCACLGHASHGRCYHRGLVLFLAWEAREIAAAGTQPAA